MRIEDALAQLQQAQHDPQARTVATAKIACAAIDPGLFVVLQAAAIPHWFDAATLAALLECPADTAAQYYALLLSLPQVESYAARHAHNVHEATRLALRKQLATEDRPRFDALSRRAAANFSGPEPHQQIEALYHRLIGGEPMEAAAALEQLFQQWYRAGRVEPLQALALALEELLHGAWLQGIALARALVTMGWIRRGRLPLKQAEHMAVQAIELFVSAHDLQGEADARQFLGDTLATEGKLAAALSEYQAGKAIMLRLTQQEPDNTLWQHELSIFHYHVGNVLRVQEKLAEALREYQAYKEIRLRLTRLDPDNTGWRRNLSISYDGVGSVLQAQGKPSEALSEYQASKEIMLRLTELDPDNTSWQQVLSVSYNNLGNVLQAQGKPAEALSEYQADKEIMLRLTELDPDNTNWQRELSVSHNNVGSLLQIQRKPAEALQEFQSSKEIMLRLTALDPDNTGWQRDLSLSHYWIATALEQLGRLDEALIGREAGLAIVERLAQLDGTNADWQHGLAASRAAFQALKQRMGRS